MTQENPIKQLLNSISEGSAINASNQRIAQIENRIAELEADIKKSERHIRIVTREFETKYNLKKDSTNLEDLLKLDENDFIDYLTKSGICGDNVESFNMHLEMWRELLSLHEDLQKTKERLSSYTVEN